MNDYKVIEIKRSVFESNDREADKVYMTGPATTVFDGKIDITGISSDK